jgi:hypothetical protein
VFFPKFFVHQKISALKKKLRACLRREKNKKEGLAFPLGGKHPFYSYYNKNKNSLARGGGLAQINLIS